MLAIIEYKSLIQNFRILNLTLCYVFFEGIAQIGISILNGKKQFIRANKFSFCYEAGRSLLLLGVLIFTKNINFVPVIYILSASVYAIIIFIVILRKHIDFILFIKRLYNPNLLSYYTKTYLFFISAIAYQLYFRIDMVLLKRLSTPVELGTYATAYKFFEVFLFVPAVLSGIIFPTVVGLFKREQRIEFERYLKELQTKAVILISSLIVLVITFSDVIINVFFGEGFSGSIIIMQILFFTSFLYSFNFIYPVLFNSTGNEKYTIYIFLSGFALNFLLNYFFLPLYGAKAAALINFLTEGIVTLLYFEFLKRKGLSVISFKALTFILYCIFLGVLRIIMTSTIYLPYLISLIVIFLGFILFIFRKEINSQILLNARQ
jgi:O-antigen/teichoic acid export membrane protein